MSPLAKMLHAMRFYRPGEPPRGLNHPAAPGAPIPSAPVTQVFRPDGRGGGILRVRTRGRWPAIRKRPYEGRLP